MPDITVTYFIGQILPHCTDSDILQLKSAVDSMVDEIEKRKQFRYKERLTAIKEDMARQMLDLKRELGIDDEPKKTRRQKPRFQNPTAPTQTWSGRGRQPEWFIKALEAGTPVNELLIKEIPVATESTDIPF